MCTFVKRWCTLPEAELIRRLRLKWFVAVMNVLYMNRACRQKKLLQLFNLKVEFLSNCAYWSQHKVNKSDCTPWSACLKTAKQLVLWLTVQPNKLAVTNNWNCDLVSCWTWCEGFFYTTAGHSKTGYLAEKSHCSSSFLLLYSLANDKKWSCRENKPECYVLQAHFLFIVSSKWRQKETDYRHSFPVNPTLYSWAQNLNTVQERCIVPQT